MALVRREAHLRSAMTGVAPLAPLAWEAGLCAPARFPGASCDRCVTACPRDALARVPGGLAAGAGDCDVCGLCVPACPTGALEIASLPRRVLATRLAASSERSVVVRCERAKPSRSAVGVPCIGLLDETALVEPLLRGGAAGLSLRTGDCRACPRGAAFDRVFPPTLRATRGLLASVGRDPDLLGVEADPDIGSSRVDVGRRGLLRALLGGLSLAEAPAPPVHRAPSRRERLLELLRSLPTVPRPAALDSLPAALPQLGNGCWGCTVCAHTCPTRAIRRTETRTEVVLEVDADACVACGACAEACGPQAITYQPLPASRIPVGSGMREAARLTVRACAHCAETFAGMGAESSCPGCRCRAALVDSAGSGGAPPSGHAGPCGSRRAPMPIPFG